MAIIPQYFVKVYSEGLGRIPAVQEFGDIYNLHGYKPCTREELLTVAQKVLLSPEAGASQHSVRQRVRAIYRVMLNRDPDQGGWDYFTTRPLASTISEISVSSEYGQMVSKICSSSQRYGFGVTPLSGITLTANQLQIRLNAASPGGIVELEPTDRVLVDKPVIIPQSVTLRTRGNPQNYIGQASLLREKHFQGPVVEVKQSGRLESMYVDGRLPDLGRSSLVVNGSPLSVYESNVEITGSNAVVTGNRVFNSSGWAHIFVSPHGTPANGAVVTNNQVIGYATDRNTTGQLLFTDGIAVGATATVTGNTVVDATDVPIIAFDPYAQGNASQIGNNRILQAGNNAWYMMGTETAKATTNVPRFTGRFYDNQLQTLGGTRARVGVFNGTRVAHGSGAWNTSSTPVFTGNYGYVNYELFGIVSDAGVVSLPNLGLNPMPFASNKGCQQQRYIQIPPTSVNAAYPAVDGCLINTGEL
ncbi:MAG: hypothetical protein RLZZ511_382 [Cyanobacteriota bacterium]